MDDDEDYDEPTALPTLSIHSSSSSHVFPTIITDSPLPDTPLQRSPREEALRALEEKVGKEEATELNELYKLVDKDDSNTISQDEFIELLHTMSVRPSPMEMDIMFGELDIDGSGDIEYVEFLKFMTQPALNSQVGKDLIRAMIGIERLGTHPMQADIRSPKSRTNISAIHDIWTQNEFELTGIVHEEDVIQALRTYIPDKIKTPQEAKDLLKHIRLTRENGIDYISLIAANTDQSTCIPNDAELNEMRRRRELAVQRAAAQPHLKHTHSLSSSSLSSSLSSSTNNKAATNNTNNNNVANNSSSNGGQGVHGRSKSRASLSNPTHHRPGSLPPLQPTRPISRLPTHLAVPSIVELKNIYTDGKDKDVAAGLSVHWNEIEESLDID